MGNLINNWANYARLQGPNIETWFESQIYLRPWALRNIELV